MNALTFAKLVSFVLIFTSGGVKASEAFPGPIRDRIYSSIAKPMAQHVECIAGASRIYKVNEFVLLATLLLERGDLAPVNPNNNGTVDYGVAQINTLRKSEIEAFGFSFDHLANFACANILVAAYLLAEEIQDATDYWTGVANYHYDSRGQYPKHHFKRKKEVFSLYIRIISVA